MPTLSQANADAVLREHVRLRAASTAVTHSLEARPDVEPQAWRDGLVAALASLEDGLAVHFAHEEESGLFEQLRESDDPGAAEHLLAEHGAFLHRLERLRQDGARLGGVAALGGWRADVRRLIEDIEAHEQRENELLSATLDRGTGAGD